ncbi:MAG: ribonuclease III, partial [Devosia sp.]
MSRRPRDRSRLEARLGYRFADPELLDRALTHSSAVSPGKRIANSYQRLEFLGDRVLGLVIADLLYRKLPKANEGELSRSLNALVRKESCAAIARRLELGPDLNLGESEARTGGAQKDAILGDVTEAIIGAVYCDGGLGKAYELIERLFGDQIGLANSDRADAKTTLQEWAQAQG